MAIDTGVNIIDGVVLQATLNTILAVPNTTNFLRTRIDSIAFTNFDSTRSIKLTVKIISFGSADGNERFLIKEKPLRPNETYTAPELIGQGINKGGTLQAFSEFATSIACTATGTEYTT